MSINLTFADPASDPCILAFEEEMRARGWTLRESPNINKVEKLLVFAFLEGYAVGFVRTKPLPKDKLLQKALWIKDTMLSSGAVLTYVDESVLRVDHGVAQAPMFILSLDWLLNNIEKDCRHSGELRAAQQGAWLPIDTAPRDGATWIEVGMPSDASPTGWWEAVAIVHPAPDEDHWTDGAMLMHYNGNVTVAGFKGP